MAYIGNIPVPDSTEHRQEFTATASQTTFTTSGYANGFVDVYLNGVKLATADFTANDNSTVVLTSGASAGDILAVVARTQTTDGSAGFASTSEVQGTHTTGSITTGTTALTVASATGISTGDYVVGEGITPGTTVTAGGGTTSLTLSANAGATLSSDPVSFFKADKVLSPGLVAGGLCRAWVNFDGLNSPYAITGAFNVSSVTRTAQGTYTVTFTSSMPDNDYSAVATSGGSKSPNAQAWAQTHTQLTTSVQILNVGLGTSGSTYTNTDASNISLAIFR